MLTDQNSGKRGNKNKRGKKEKKKKSVALAPMSALVDRDCFNIYKKWEEK